MTHLVKMDPNFKHPTKISAKTDLHTTKRATWNGGFPPYHCHGYAGYAVTPQQGYGSKLGTPFFFMVNTKPRLTKKWSPRSSILTHIHIRKRVLPRFGGQMVPCLRREFQDPGETRWWQSLPFVFPRNVAFLVQKTHWSIRITMKTIVII